MNSDLIRELEQLRDAAIGYDRNVYDRAITALRSQQEQIEALETHLRWVPTLPEDVECWQTEAGILGELEPVSEDTDNE